MTAFAFILGVVPLAIAHEAGAASQRSLGTAVAAGMLVATALGVFLIPALYVAIQGGTEWITRSKKKPVGLTENAEKPAPPPEEPVKKKKKAKAVEAPAQEEPADVEKKAEKPEPVEPKPETSEQEPSQADDATQTESGKEEK